MGGPWGRVGIAGWQPISRFGQRRIAQHDAVPCALVICDRSQYRSLSARDRQRAFVYIVLYGTTLEQHQRYKSIWFAYEIIFCFGTQAVLNTGVRRLRVPLLRAGRLRRSSTSGTGTKIFFLACRQATIQRNTA